MSRKRRPGAPSANGRKGAIKRAATLSVVLWLVLTSTAQANLTPQRLRQLVQRSHPYLARIIDREDGRWDPTISYGGGHNPNDSYGLCQANPGTKMATYSYTAAGHRAGEPTSGDWRSSVWAQLAWCVNYAVGRYGSEAGAWWYWQAHSSW